jgi:membrane-associated protease RseP (regulator of RpoE activity)
VSGALAGFLFAAVVLLMVVLVGGSVGVEWFLGVIPLPLAVLPGPPNFYLNFLISNLLWINVFWGLVNLMPVIPLDGGNIARNLILNADPMNGTTKALWVSTIAGGVIAAVGLVFLNSIFIGLFFGFLALGSYQQLRPGIGRRW